MTASDVTAMVRARRWAGAWEIVKPLLIAGAIMSAGIAAICWPIVREMAQ